MQGSTTCKVLRLRGHQVCFVHRERMRRRKDRQGRAARLPRVLPVTTLPVDGTNNAAVQCPMDGNDSYGDCMEAMACHVDNVWTYGMGQAGWTESVFDQQKLIQQYIRASGGDNGLDEPTLLDSCWRPGLAGNPAATYVDSLDVDVTNIPLTQFLIDNFFAVELMWSVPDDFINQFNTGVVFDQPMPPDPANGHGTPLADIDVQGRYRLWTWGTWCWVSPAFVAGVDPSAFVVFSARQFNPLTGLDAKGRHITQQASLWVQAGGNAIPAAILNAFPPPNPSPPPVPAPPVPPVPAPPGPPAPPALTVMSLSGDTSAGGYVLMPIPPGVPDPSTWDKLTPQQIILIIEAILAAILQFLPPAPTPPPVKVVR